MKKLIVSCLVVLALAIGAKAQTVTLPLAQGSLDISGLLANLHPGYAFDQHKDNLGTLSIPLISFKQASGLPIADINGGFIFAQSGQLPVTSSGKAGLFTAVAFRLDSLMHVAGATNWFQQHVTAAPVPSIELGPLGGYFAEHGGWLYGLYVSARL